MVDKWKMKKTCIRPISDKQKERNRQLAQIKPPKDGRCQECGKLPDWRGLSKHHIEFRSHCGSDAIENLIWLCGKCSSKAHGIKEV